VIESTQHNRIFLQVCDDENSEWCGEVTWCEDRIHDDDVEYIRADLVDQLRAALALARHSLLACAAMVGHPDNLSFIRDKIAAIDVAMKEKS